MNKGKPLLAQGTDNGNAIVFLLEGSNKTIDPQSDEQDPIGGMQHPQIKISNEITQRPIKNMKAESLPDMKTGKRVPGFLVHKNGNKGTNDSKVTNYCGGLTLFFGCFHGDL
ncbi:hypothetical protein [Robertkochia marina]|uniref:hypothetical protein n=1 Tax=Robertkochia marina TaxID=1227945 RepID=UPI001454C2DB|nr:hypothetical protein [Robertkochia marina]